MEAFLEDRRFCNQVADPTNVSINVFDPVELRYFIADMSKFVEIWKNGFKLRLLHHTTGLVIDTSVPNLDLWFKIRKLIDNITHLTFIRMGKALLIPELYMTPKDKAYLCSRLGVTLINELELIEIGEVKTVSNHAEWGYQVEDGQAKLPDLFAVRPKKSLLMVGDDYGSFKLPEIELSEVNRQKFGIITTTPDTWLFYTLMTGLKEVFCQNEKIFTQVVGALLNPSGIFFNFCGLEKYMFLVEYWLKFMPVRIDHLQQFGMTKIALLNLAREKFAGYEQTLNTYLEWKITELTCHDNVAADYRLAQILFFKICYKYVVAPYLDNKGAKKHQWFEFVDMNSEAKPDELFKWRQTIEIVTIKNLIRFQLIPMFTKVYGRISQDPTYARYQERFKTLWAAVKHLESDSNITRLVDITAEYMIDHGFTSRMNKDKDILGVGNGVLELSKKDREMRLIRGYHHYVIDRYSTAIWDEDAYLWLMKAEPKLPSLVDHRYRKVQELMHWWRDAHAEPDAAEYRLFYLSQTLSGAPKPGFMLQLIGNGQRGKTTWTILTRNALGKYASDLSPKLLLKSTFQESANSHSTALMMCNGLHYGAMNESPPGGELDEMALKTLFSMGAKVTGRQLQGAEQELSIDFCLEMTTNHEVQCRATDWGTHRRIKIYRPKFVYVSNPSAPHEKAIDPMMKLHVHDPEYYSAWLTILSHYYSRFVREYGVWENVPLSPTIEKETWDYRISQNQIYHFAYENVVKLKDDIKPENYDKTRMNQMVAAFQSWFLRKNPRSTRYNSADTVESELKTSILEPFIAEDLDGLRAAKCFMGLRIITLENEHYPKGQYDPKREEPIGMGLDSMKKQITK